MWWLINIFKQRRLREVPFEPLFKSKDAKKWILKTHDIFPQVKLQIVIYNVILKGGAVIQVKICFRVLCVYQLSLRKSFINSEQVVGVNMSYRKRHNCQEFF